jgi:hypothetical protein
VDFAATRDLHRFRDGPSGFSQPACCFHEGTSLTSMSFTLPDVGIDGRRSRDADPPSCWRSGHATHPSRSHVNIAEHCSLLSSGLHSLAAHLTLHSLPSSASPAFLSLAGHSDEPDQRPNPLRHAASLLRIRSALAVSHRLDGFHPRCRRASATSSDLPLGDLAPRAHGSGPAFRKILHSGSLMRFTSFPLTR